MEQIKLVLLMTILVHAGSSLPFERHAAAGREKEQYASWDDVNVIAHGLLQLGHGLKEHADKTKGQMRDISAKLKIFNGSVAELGKLTQQLHEEGEALKAKAQELGKREDKVLNISSDLQANTEELKTERQKVHDRMGRLEKKVDSILQGESQQGLSIINSSDAHLIQRMLETQNKRIDALVERIRQQQDKLEKQGVRLQTLQTEIKLRKVKSFVRRKVEDIPINGSTEQSDSPNVLASDCHELHLRGENVSGVYTIQPHNSQPFDVFCEMTSEDGWTVIQRREDGSLDFNKLWQVYQQGFGSLNGEFWLGLEKIHSMSEQGKYVLLVELSDWNRQTQSIKYPFQLGGEESNYALYLQQDASGDLDSGLTTGPSGLPFSTSDRDNDLKADMNCAKLLSGGWWFSNCGHSNLNGKYHGSRTPMQRHHRKQAVFWKTWQGRYHPLKTTVMKIAPAVNKS